MKAYRLLCLALLVGGLLAAVYWSRPEPPTGVRMADATKVFLNRLTSEQKLKATLSFYKPERINWHGKLKHQAALAILEAGLSKGGYTTALAEFLNVQNAASGNPAHYVQSCWPSLKNASAPKASERPRHAAQSC
jgi:hypothetical protein